MLNIHSIVLHQTVWNWEDEIQNPLYVLDLQSTFPLSDFKRAKKGASIEKAVKKLEWKRPLMNVTKVGTLQAPAINGEAHQVRPGETWPMWAQSADMRLSAMEYFCVFLVLVCPGGNQPWNLFLFFWLHTLYVNYVIICRYNGFLNISVCLSCLGLPRWKSTLEYFFLFFFLHIRKLCLYPQIYTIVCQYFCVILVLVCSSGDQPCNKYFFFIFLHI